ncbi:hypothetical protein [Tenacibaculum skagerrakense]|uniref:hypothetical protein n=1 Tax=Tenacibaculum skagerrakense TaxID=186571 RepID=UPI00104FCE20|nr:hypothetical protein [Tenacibaculum skagerrakense]
MKKRHEQKLVVLSIALIVLINIPMILIFNHKGEIFGFPVLYFSIFILWILSVLISYYVLVKYYE